MTLPRSSLGTTSLGAVGGARGVAAGGLRILVEFLTQYDSAAVKQLESDLSSLSAEEAQAANKSLQATRSVETAQKKLVEIQRQLTSEIAKQNNPAQVRREVKKIQDIGILSKAGQAEVANLKALLGPNEKITGLLTRQARLKNGLPGLTAAANKQEFIRLGILEQQQAVEAQLSGFQRLRAAVPARLSGLALGALGGVVGGAVIGVGFAAAEAAIDSVGEALNNLVDPGRKAREIIKEVGAAVNDLAGEEENRGDLLKGAESFLKSLGLEGDQATIAALAEAAAISQGNEQLEARRQILEITNHLESERARLVRETASAVAASRGIDSEIFDLTDLGVEAEVAAQAERELANAENAQAIAARDAAAASAELEARNRALAASAQLAAFAEEQLVSALNAAGSVKLGQFDSQIQSLQEAGPSKRTLAIQAQIEKVQNAARGGASNNSAELANIAEERALILLRMRLRLMGTAINLEKYSGKFLLEAINAKLKALQKEAAAQDRLNRLLDLQYRMSQKLRRQEGESISDFLERRAQESRHQLSEQRDIEQETVRERLEELRDKTQDEVSLAELAERRKNAAVKSGTDNRLRNLQKELAASQKADRAALASKIKALQQQKEGYQKALATAIEFSNKEKNEKIRIAITAAKRLSDLAQLSGQVTGLAAAETFLKALLSSGVLSAAETKAVRSALTRVTTSLELYDRKIAQFASPPGGAQRFKSGGLIPLTNASSPFGANVRFGEEGTEYGLILQQSIAKGLKGNMGGVNQVGPFYMNGGDDPLRDRFYAKKMVREAVSEALS